MSTLTKSQRLQVSEAFRLAKQYLHGRGLYGQKYICYSIGSAFNMGAMTRSMHDLSRKIINERLDDCGTLEVWMCSHHPHLYCSENLSEFAFREKMQETRHAWLDSLIEEFSK